MAKPVVYIVIYSLYHHVYKLALSVKEGLESKGVEAKLFQVPETLSDEVLVKMQAPQKLDLPYITVDKLAEPDGIIFGFPTRFGTLPAQMKAFLDASGALWAKGALAGKFAATFFSTASQHGGQETTALNTLTYFAHHGMLYVPFGYANAALQNNNEVIGGSAYGAGTISDGDGSRQPTKTELDVAVNQGANFAEVVTTFVKGRDGANTVVQDKSTAVNTVNTTSATGTAAAVAGTAAVAATTAALAATTASKANKTSTTANKSADTSNVKQANATIAFNETSSSTANFAATTAATLAAGAVNIKNLLGNSANAANSANTAKSATSGNKEASKIGAEAGATAAGNANVVKESIVNAKDKTKKKKKWFCCM